MGLAESQGVAEISDFAINTLIFYFEEEIGVQLGCINVLYAGKHIIAVESR